jgi:hypothetical protein
MQSVAAFLAARGDLAELPDVGARNEGLPRPDQHRRAHGCIGADPLHVPGDALGHSRAERVHGRVVHGDDCDIAFAGERNQVRHCDSPSWDQARACD